MGSDVDLVMITQAVDEEDPVLGFTPGWVNALAENVRRLSVFCLRKGRCELRGNVSLRSLGRGKAMRLWRLRKGLKADLREMDVRAIFAHMCPRYVVAARWVVRGNVPVVLWYAHSAKGFWLKLAHGVSRFILTPTAESCPVESGKVKVVGHGIDTQKFAPVLRRRAGGTVLLSAGRITPVKKYEFLIEAVAVAARLLQPQELTLRIVGSPCSRGDQKYFSRLKKTVRKAGVDGIVQFRSPVPYTRIKNEYAECDMFVNTAIGHSIDKAALEAMACGKILVTSNRNFRPVLGEHAGLLVADDKDPADLGKKIARLTRIEPVEKDKLGLALREIVVQGHNLKRLMKKIVETVAEL